MHPVPVESLLHALHWRYATQKFDPVKKIPADDWHVLEQALVLTPSSIGLQPWKFIIVTDQVMKAQLVPASYGQAKVADCSHFVVLAVRKNLGADHVDRHIARMVEVRGVTTESLGRFRQMATRNLDQARTEERLDTWQTYQVYIALGQFMASAAVVGVDTCAMEGIDPAKFDEILGLKDTGFATVVACAAGYRMPDDKYASTKKVRFKPDDVITRI